MLLQETRAKSSRHGSSELKRKEKRTHIMNVVAFDSKEFRRQGSAAGSQMFFAPLGIGVEIKDNSYKETYVSAISELCREFGVRNTRKAIDSNTLQQTCGQARSITALEKFLEKVAPSIEAMTAYYMIISTINVPTIKMYGRDKAPEERPTVEFLRFINPDFVHLCAWKYVETHEGEQKLFLDYFQSKESTASLGLLAKAGGGKVTIFPHGDLCNEYVSTADLLAKLVDARLYKAYGKLGDEGIKESFNDVSFKVDSQFIGQPDLANIVPYSQRATDFSDFMTRPMYYVVLDSDIPPGTARRLFESSLSIDYVINAALDTGGAYKFLDMNIDGPMIRDGDVFITTGSPSEKVVDYISGLFNIHTIKADSRSEKEYIYYT